MICLTHYEGKYWKKKNGPWGGQLIAINLSNFLSQIVAK